MNHTAFRPWRTAVLVAGAVALASCAPLRPQRDALGPGHGPAIADGTVNVRAFGAVGDGKADDTEAIRRALAALPAKGGVLFFPPGHYLTDTIVAPEFTTFLGRSAWSYGQAGGTILSPARDDQPCLIDARKKRGNRFVGLTLLGLKKGKAMHGIVSANGGMEQNLVIDDCRIEQFTGSGFSTLLCWVWSVRNSMFWYNGEDGIDALYSYDAWIHNNQFAGNARYGLHANSSMTITGNRIEANERGGLEVNPDAENVQITANLFCGNHGPAIEIPGNRARSIAITGNTMRYSGSGVAVDSVRSCHVRLEGIHGLVFTGNSLHSDRAGPQVGMVLGTLTDSVVANNVLCQGGLRELILDKGGHRNTVIANNPGSLTPANSTERTAAGSQP